MQQARNRTAARCHKFSPVVSTVPGCDTDANGVGGPGKVSLSSINTVNFSPTNQRAHDEHTKRFLGVALLPCIHTQPLCSSNSWSLLRSTRNNKPGPDDAGNAPAQGPDCLRTRPPAAHPLANQSMGAKPGAPSKKPFSPIPFHPRTAHSILRTIHEVSIPIITAKQNSLSDHMNTKLIFNSRTWHNYVCTSSMSRSAQREREPNSSAAAFAAQAKGTTTQTNRQSDTERRGHAPSPQTGSAC